MFFYKLKISYDGTNYNGWQKQPNIPTISGTLEQTFKKVFFEKVSIVGASRTDAGVHAKGQIARIRTNLEIDPIKLMGAWNNSLPPDIVINSIESCNQLFHPLKNVKEKIYFYDFFLERPSPFIQRFGYFYNWPIDIEKLKDSLNLFIGEHDFRSFSTGYEMKSTIRIIDNIKLDFIKDINAYRVTIIGKSFLHHMIRRIIGASLEIASRKQLKIEYITEILNAKNPEHTLPNAPAKGLLLYKITYDN